MTIRPANAGKQQHYVASSSRNSGSSSANKGNASADNTGIRQRRIKSKERKANEQRLRKEQNTFASQSPLPSTLPPVEKTPVLVVYFSSKASPQLIDLVVKRLLAGGLICLQRGVHEGKTLLRLTTSQEMLEETAESIHLMKLTADTQTVEYFTVAARERFRKDLRQQQQYQQYQRSSQQEEEEEDDDLCLHGTVKPSTKRKRNKRHWLFGGGGAEGRNSNTLLNLDQYGMFTSNEWCLLIRRILDEITVLPEKETSSELSRILDEQYHADYHVRNYVGSTAFNMFQSEYREHGTRSACLRHVLQTYDLVENVTLVHLPKIRQDILNDTWWPWWQLEPPVDAIQDYYG